MEIALKSLTCFPLVCVFWQSPTPGPCLRPKALSLREATATPARTMQAAAACSSTGAIGHCLPTSLASSMTSTATTWTAGHGSSSLTHTHTHIQPCFSQLCFTWLGRSAALCYPVYHMFSCHARLCFRFILKESGFPRYLHSAVLLSGTLLIFGGNTHNDTSLSNGAKCFSADFLAYDIGKTG